MDSECTKTRSSVMDFDSVSALKCALGDDNETVTHKNSNKGKTDPILNDVISACSWKCHLQPDTSEEQTLELEMQRLLELKSFNILDSTREEMFERMTAFASRIFNVPIALLSFVDLDRQWFLSNRGLDVRETPRSQAFCAHAIYSKLDLLVVPDATQDVRFKDNPLVTGPPHIRFYAGAPLVSPKGHKLGTFCIIDTKPRVDGLDLSQKQNLRELAAITMSSLVARKETQDRERDEKSKVIACTAHDLLTPLSSIRLNLSLLMNDQKLLDSMDRQQRELIEICSSCSEIMSTMCQRAMESYRGAILEKHTVDENLPTKEDLENMRGSFRIAHLLKHLTTMIDSFPKLVPLTIDVHENVPPIILSDDLKIFRAALNFLTNSCKHTKVGSISFRIFVVDKECKKVREKGELYRPGDMLMFECEDTGPGVDLEKYPKLFRSFMSNEKNSNTSLEKDDHNEMPNAGLGLQSVASNISNLGGQYGFRPRGSVAGNDGGFIINPSTMQRTYSSDNVLCWESDSAEPEKKMTGSLFWFSIPLMRPVDTTTQGMVDVSASVPKDIKLDMNDVHLEKLTVSEVQVEKPLATPSQFIGENIENRKRKISRDSNLDEVDTKVSRSRVAIDDDDYFTPAFTSSDENSSILFRPFFDYSKKERCKRALVIDDSLIIRKSVGRVLTNVGFKVSQACNGMEGLKKLKHNLFDVVFCDFLMPVMDGLDCVKQYREWEIRQRPDFQQVIIGISAHASQNDAKRGIDVGMNKFLSKPLHYDVLKNLTTENEIQSASKKLDDMFEKYRKLSLDNSMNDEKTRDNAEMDDGMSSTTSSRVENSGGLVCLLAETSRSLRKAIIKHVESRGFGVCPVNNGEDALRMLKMRHWNAVFMDDKMPLLAGTSCILRFREWEAMNRVARQCNVYLLSEHFFNNDKGCHTMYPPGFDGALGKPINIKYLDDILDGATKAQNSEPQILTR